jgi:hypothetical protein
MVLYYAASRVFLVGKLGGYGASTKPVAIVRPNV